MVHARMKFGVGILVGLGAALIAAPGHAASGLASIGASTKLQVKGCGKLSEDVTVQLALAEPGTWSLVFEADTATGTYLAGGKGGRTLTLTIDPASLTVIQAGLREEAGTLCGAPADSAVVTVKKARAKLDKAGTSVNLLVKLSLAGGGNPFKKGKYMLKGSGSLGPLPTTTTTSSTVPTTTSTTSTTLSTVTTTSTTTSSTSPTVVSTTSTTFTTISTVTTTSTTVSTVPSTTTSTTSLPTTSTSTTSTSLPSSTTSTTTIGPSTTSTTTVGPSTTSTTTIGSSTTSTTTVGPSTTSTTTIGSSTTSTTTVGPSTTSTTTVGSSTTSTTMIGTSTSTTVFTTTTTSTTMVPPTGYGDCLNGGPDACTPAEACLSGAFEGSSVGMCTVPCEQVEDCPAPTTGNPRVGCGPNVPACLLFCDAGETCPDGMECVAGMLCFFTAPCTPNCEGRTCGDDGCGLTCGDCSSGNVCADGQCVSGDSCIGRCNTFDEFASCQCDPPCVGADDCCSDICDAGACQGEDICMCVPDCTGRVCGSDGCLGTCGECSTPGDVCTQAGQCAAGDSCVGRCDTFDEAASCQCDVGCVAGGDCCADVCDAGVCDSATVCTCVPDCTERVCGSDGCGGSCGDCLTVGDVCSSAGQCVSGTSCVGRCDTFDENALCQCDPDCTTFGDCCDDRCDAGVCEGVPPCL